MKVNDFIKNPQWQGEIYIPLVKEYFQISIDSQLHFSYHGKNYAINKDQIVKKVYLDGSVLIYVSNRTKLRTIRRSLSFPTELQIQFVNTARIPIRLNCSGDK